MIKGLYKIFDHWHSIPGQAVWLVSDLHFGDAELRAGQPNRPTDEEIIANINQCVGKYGTLICLGDVGDPETAKRLKGYKVLICGNHDAGASNYEGIFDEVYTGPLMIAEKLILSHEPIQNLNWAINLHGHDHRGVYKSDWYHYNFALEAIGWMPVNFNRWMLEGNFKNIESLHRQTIDLATVRKSIRLKRGKKNG